MCQRVAREMMRTAEDFKANALRWLDYFYVIPDSLPETQGRALGSYYRNILHYERFMLYAERAKVAQDGCDKRAQDRAIKAHTITVCGDSCEA
jgi:hypothetical protein